MPNIEFENKSNRDFRNSKDKKEKLKEMEIVTKRNTMAYDIDYLNIDDCLKRFDKLAAECEKAKASIDKPDRNIAGQGDVTTAINKAIKEYDRVWAHLLKLIYLTKDTISTFEEISKEADNQ